MTTCFCPSNALNTTVCEVISIYTHIPWPVSGRRRELKMEQVMAREMAKLLITALIP